MEGKANKTIRRRRWERYLELAADAGSIAMSLRDRPTRLDWLGVGLRALGLAFRVRAERRRAMAGDPWEYFENRARGCRWKEIPSEFCQLVMDHVGRVEIDEDYWNGEEGALRVCLGYVGQERVGWVQEGDKDVVDGPYLLADRERETLRELGGREWRRLGTPHAAFGPRGLVADPFDGEDVFSTAQLRELCDRARRFAEAGMRRSVLLAGPPGTGKSVGIRWLARSLGRTSLRVELQVLAEKHGRYAEEDVAAGLGTLLKLLEPEILIIDDIDRVVAGGSLLQFLELAGRRCRLVLASANCTGKMLGAALRPGRFDELVQVDRLDPDLLRRMLDADADLFERLEELPAAYVTEFLKRRRVLGRERALEEITELEARKVLVEEKTEDGD